MNLPSEWKMDDPKPGDLFTWIYREVGEPNALGIREREHLAGTAGRVRLSVAKDILLLLNIPPEVFETVAFAYKALIGLIPGARRAHDMGYGNFSTEQVETAELAYRGLGYLMRDMRPPCT